MTDPREQIRARMEADSLTPYAVAVRTGWSRRDGGGVTQQQVIDYLAGKSDIRVSTLVAIARAVGLTIEANLPRA